MRTAILDGDTLVYSAALRAEKPIEWDDGLWTLHAFMDEGVNHLEHLIQAIKRGIGATETVMVLSDYETSNFRKTVMPEYKAHRKNVRRPVIWKALREYLMETHDAFFFEGIHEGDDAVGILFTGEIIPGEKICVSIDKDMKTLPGKHLVWTEALGSGDDMEEHIFEVSEEEANLFHLTQTIAGDATDGYPGAPGWGMVRAERLLRAGLVLEPHEHTFTRGKRQGETDTKWKPGSEGTPWEIVVSAYESVGLSEIQALRTAQVARICRVDDYDFETGEVILWTP